ncbi:hypothetical protein COT82_01470 [Candidatus Campbellbacteria bacterium CG10_big_fil_rev_8_21_14_0_10_35_52]|uniref:Uncharacterized protein n=1 Tax=Candidatus Campbellbacteria bacterium CG10_big_fil_rev_8_21_14_0_10_35_52 TaxID=1974527 RepID=A0A2M6WVL7_9BACT|nr:MAG: hypothetical protein COT82_01470 [Candidatus Campbellbacteria bacterium CG10_big_fil_rev_8_21_14_0_10_35_52]
MTKIKHPLIFFFIVSLFLTIFTKKVYAAASFMKPIVPKCASGGICGYCDLISLVNNIIEFLIYFSVIMATLMFMYAGFQYLTAGGKGDKITSAHKIFTNVFLGLVFVLAAFLIVDTIMKTFLPNGSTKFGPWNEIECKLTNIEK